jgi:ABC-2 type transport system permease protein
VTAFTSARRLATATHMLLVETTRELGIILGFTIIFPIGILFFLNQLVAPDLRVQVLVGTIMMETALLNINGLAQSLGNDKATRVFDLWVSLPVSPVVYALANALSILPFTLASALFTLGVAVTIFHVAIPVATFPFLVGGFVLVWASTLGIGYLVGVYGGTPRQINSTAQIVGVILTFFAPIFYPVTVLPVPLQVLAYAWPLTWGSEFLVAIIHGAGPTVLLSGAVLVGFAAAWMVLIGSGLRWRQA